MRLQVDRACASLLLTLVWINTAACKRGKAADKRSEPAFGPAGSAHATTSPALQPEGAVYPRVVPSRVTSLSLTGAGVDVQFSRSGNEWHIVSPIEAPADKRAIAGALRELSRLEFVRDPVAHRRADWAQHRVGEHEVVHIDVNQGETKLPTLHFGRKDKVRVGADARVWTAFHANHYTFARDHVRFWRDRTVMRLAAVDIAAIEVARTGRPTKRYQVLQDGDGGQRWRGDDTRGVAEQLARSLQELVAHDVAVVDRESAGLADPRAKITIELRSGQRQVLLIGAQAQRYVHVARADASTIWLVPSAQISIE